MVGKVINSLLSNSSSFKSSLYCYNNLFRLRVSFSAPRQFQHAVKNTCVIQCGELVPFCTNDNSPFHCSIGVSCCGNQFVKLVLLGVRKDEVGSIDLLLSHFWVTNHDMSCFIKKVLSDVDT